MTRKITSCLPYENQKPFSIN
uniref:Uncharacterized protein n=1 Tax=Tetranychus urticae TaxID=32264 RepID=T1KRM6_TETUR